MAERLEVVYLDTRIYPVDERDLAIDSLRKYEGIFVPRKDVDDAQFAVVLEVKGTGYSYPRFSPVVRAVEDVVGAFELDYPGVFTSACLKRSGRVDGRSI